MRKKAAVKKEVVFLENIPIHLKLIDLLVLKIIQNVGEESLVFLQIYVQSMKWNFCLLCYGKALTYYLGRGFKMETKLMRQF